MADTKEGVDSVFYVVVVIVLYQDLVLMYLKALCECDGALDSQDHCRPSYHSILLLHTVHLDWSRCSCC